MISEEVKMQGIQSKMFQLLLFRLSLCSKVAGGSVGTNPNAWS